MGSSAEYGGLTKPQKETVKCVVKSLRKSKISIYTLFNKTTQTKKISSDDF